MATTLAPLLFALAAWACTRYPAFVFSAFIVVSFFTLNSGLSLLNRWALGVHGFRFPLAMTALHMLFGSFALSPVMLLRSHYREAHERILTGNGRALALIGATNAVQIAANNASLALIELSLNQIIRAFGPVIVAVLAVVIEGKRTTSVQSAALVCVSCGVALTVFRASQPEEEAGSSHMLGALLVMASIAMQSLVLSLSGRIMGGVKLDGFQMAFYSGPVGFVALAPFVSIEWAMLLDALADEPAACLGFLLGSSLMAVAYNVVVFQSSKTLSSVGTAVLANMKIVVLVALSAILLGEMSTWTARRLIGMVLAFGGTMAYSYLKMQQPK